MSDIDKLDPNDQFYLNQSQKTIDAWRASEADAATAREMGFEDPYTADAMSAGALQNATEQATPQEGEQQQRSPEELKGHSGYDRLGLDQPYNPAEAKDPGDPRWRHIYDKNGDGVVDWKDGIPKLEDAAGILTNPLKFAAGTVGLGSRNLAGERKHAFTSGTGTADLETNIREGVNAWRGIPFDLVNGIVTLPENTYRTWLLGEDLKDQQLYFDPAKALGIEDPWQGTTIGNFTRVLGTFYRADRLIRGMASGTTAWQNLGKVGKLGPFPRGGALAQTMLAEGGAMSISKIRQDGTVFNLLQDQLSKIHPSFGEALNWIAVDEYDHPAVKELKGQLEAMGIPFAFASVFAVGRAGKKFANRQHFKATAKRLPPAPGTFGRPDVDELARVIDSELDQADEMGKAQLDAEATTPVDLPADGSPSKSRFRADKNRPIADGWQGAHTSVNTAARILNQLDALDDLPSGYGSTDSPISALEAERAAYNVALQTELLAKAAKELLGEPYYQGLMKDVGNRNLDFNEVFRSSLERFMEIVGRDAQGMSPEQFWKPIIGQFSEVKGRGANTAAYQAWALENVVASDLVNGALFKDLRTRARGARAVAEVGDVLSSDGPMKSIADRLIFGLTSVKRSRFLISDEVAKLKGPERARVIAERTGQLHDETTDGVSLMMQFLKDSDSEEMAQGILEVFSMSNKIRNWKDFDAWMRQKVRGGDFGNHNKQGLLMKELGGVMTNSILSGPKTPLRAIMGTTANAYINEVNTLLGANLRGWAGQGDDALRASSAASAQAMFQLIPDAFKVFRANLDSYFTGDIRTLRTRFSEYTKNDEAWDLMGEWAERQGTNGDKAAYYLANTARQMNDNKFLTWSSRVMGATDDTFRWLLSKARARKKAMLSVMKENPGMQITPEMLKKAEDIEFSRLHDLEGNIDITKDAFLERNFREVTLTTELEGFSKGLEHLMNRYPLTKPFFLFARTGLNGLKLSVKNLPVVGAVVKESRDILGAGLKEVQDGSLLKYGIENADDLQSAKSLVMGRQAMGTAVVSLAAHKYMSGGLTGNGPADASMNRLWKDAGWQPRSIKVGNVWVGYDSFEPFNLVLANIADIGDNLELMGPQFAEERLQLVVAALGKGINSKTYLQGVGQFFDLLSGEPGKASSRIVANLINNQVPLAGLRNEAANILNPQMRELDSSLWSHIANRNLVLRGFLPTRHDMLTGAPIRDWNFAERMFNAGSPVSLRLDQEPARQLLWNSNYDLRIATYSAPDGTNLSKYPSVRGKYQEAIGKTNIFEQLTRLANRPDVQASIRSMRIDQKRGNWHLDPMKAYLHNKLIKQLIEQKTKEAWASLRHDPLIKKVKAEQLGRMLDNQNRLTETQNLINFPK